MHLVDLLIPPRCLACTAAGAEPFCPRCADELEPDGEVHVLARGVSVVSAFRYTGPLAGAIKVVKTGGMRAGADALARLLELPAAAPATWVPAPRGRRRRRGLDLPERLAGPQAVRLLRRVGNPPEQPGLTAAERLAAQGGTFAATRPLAGGPVVLVDDVRATGATLLAAAAALRRAGAGRVLGVTLAGSGGSPSAARPRSRAAGHRRP